MDLNMCNNTQNSEAEHVQLCTQEGRGASQGVMVVVVVSTFLKYSDESHICLKNPHVLTSKV